MTLFYTYGRSDGITDHEHFSIHENIVASKHDFLFCGNSVVLLSHATDIVGFFPTYSHSTRTAIFFSQPTDNFFEYASHMGKSNSRSTFHRRRRLSVPIGMLIRLRGHSSRQAICLIPFGARALSLPLWPPSLHAGSLNRPSSPTSLL